MVTTQADRPIFNQPNRQQINNLLRIRAAIDVVAEINLDRMLYRPTSDVVFDARDGLYQQVSSAMDVANSIDSGACRRRSGNRSRICCGRRSHRRRSSITEQPWGQITAKRASPDWPALFVLKKYQTDQSNDRDPGDCVGDNKAVPELAAARIVLFKHKAVCIFSDHRRLPGKLFQDKRFVSCLCFDLPKLCDRRRARDASCNQLRRKNDEMSLKWRLCMAASRCTQHNKHAKRTKRLSTKTICYAAQINRPNAVNACPTFSLSRPISLKELGNS
jgi:hypothetical protein